MTGRRLPTGLCHPAGADAVGMATDVVVKPIAARLCAGRRWRKGPRDGWPPHTRIVACAYRLGRGLCGDENARRSPRKGFYRKVVMMRPRTGARDA